MGEREVNLDIYHCFCERKWLQIHRELKKNNYPQMNDYWLLIIDYWLLIEHA